MVGKWSKSQLFEVFFNSTVLLSQYNAKKAVKVTLSTNQPGLPISFFELHLFHSYIYILFLYTYWIRWFVALTFWNSTFAIWSMKLVMFLQFELLCQRTTQFPRKLTLLFISWLNSMPCIHIFVVYCFTNCSVNSYEAFGLKNCKSQHWVQKCCHSKIKYF